MQLGLVMAHHENHTQRKSGRGLGLGKLSYIWVSPSIFLQWPRCPLSVSAAFSCTYFVGNFIIFVAGKVVKIS